jgi:hypothetical protein
VRIVLDHPQHSAGDTLGRAATGTVNWIVGWVLLLVGLVASIVAVPATIYLALFLVGTISIIAGAGSGEEWPPPDSRIDEFFAAWAITAPLMYFGLRRGLGRIKRRRGTVLFLRRFGYQDATRVVTFAVAKTIGSSWRLITLDDANIAPLGVEDRWRRFYAIGRRLVGFAGVVGQLVLTVTPKAVGGALLVASLQVVLLFLRHDRDWQAVLRDQALDPYVEIFGSVMSGRVPFELFGLSLPGLFAVLMTVAALGAIALLAVFVSLLALLIPFLGIWMFLMFSGEALDQADRLKTATVEDAGKVKDVVAAIARRDRRTFAPRLVVLRVATPVWQATVSGLASVTSVSIIDVSEPTENLAWELGELERLFGDRYVIIGEHDRVLRWASPPVAAPAPGSLDARVAEWLDGREVLAYTSDRAGMRRFARALGRTLQGYAGEDERER